MFEWIGYVAGQSVGLCTMLEERHKRKCTRVKKSQVSSFYSLVFAVSALPVYRIQNMPLGGKASASHITTKWMPPLPCSWRLIVCKMQHPRSLYRFSSWTGTEREVNYACASLTSISQLVGPLRRFAVYFSKLMLVLPATESTA